MYYMTTLHIALSVFFMQLAGSSRVNFALEKDQFIVGYLTNSTLKTGVFSQLISGAGWLVRKYGKLCYCMHFWLLFFSHVHYNDVFVVSGECRMLIRV